jgi:putative DNA primase/helicase
MVDDSPFDDAPRLFTKEQARTFIKEAKAKLAGTTKGYNGAINNFAFVCAHFPWLVDRELCAQLVIRALGPTTGWTESDAADRATINSAYSATEAGRSWVATQAPDAPAAEEGEAPAGEIILTTPNAPMSVALEVAPMYGRPLAYWRGDIYEHTGQHWAGLDQAELEGWFYRLAHRAWWWGEDREGNPKRSPWNPYTKTVSWVMEAMKKGVIQRTGEEVHGIFCSNGVVTADRKLLPHDPERFNLASLPFAYDPASRCPEWLAFLESTLPGDVQAHAFLAEWFGYVLGQRTDLHKIGVLVGPPRCGKGTISRVLQAMVGREGWAAPTLARLGGNFGMESLIGKSLAVMGDVRWTSKHVVDAVPVMLGISGEDGFSIPRKNRDDWIGKLGARLMLMSNDTPAFTDASGALAGRMVYVAFHQSFLGREDLGLEGRLMAELPGILNWALDGLDRLNASGGRFTQSSSSAELRGEVDRDSAPVKAWAEDRCHFDKDAEFTLDALLRLYRDWLREENLPIDPSKARFSRELRSALGERGVLVERKPNGSGGKHQVVTGLRPIAGVSIQASDQFD